MNISKPSDEVTFINQTTDLRDDAKNLFNSIQHFSQYVSIEQAQQLYPIVLEAKGWLISLEEYLRP